MIFQQNRLRPLWKSWVRCANSRTEKSYCRKTMLATLQSGAVLQSPRVSRCAINSRRQVDFAAKSGAWWPGLHKRGLHRLLNHHFGSDAEPQVEPFLRLTFYQRTTFAYPVGGQPSWIRSWETDYHVGSNYFGIALHD